MLIHPMPDPIAFSLGPLSIRWYGLMYILAFLIFIILGRIRLKQPHIKKANWNQNDIEDILSYGIFGVIIGGRLGEVFFYNPNYYFSNLEQIFAIWNGGMSFHGGLLGVIFSMLIWSKKNNRNLFEVTDLIAPLVPLGYAAGRIGNFINAELPGRVVESYIPWAMIWPNIDDLPRHPSPIYQGFFDGIFLFIFLWLFSRKPKPLMATSATFLIGYGLSRFFTEFFRLPDYEIQIGAIVLSSGQLLSLPMIFLGILLFYFAYSKKN